VWFCGGSVCIELTDITRGLRQRILLRLEHIWRQSLVLQECKRRSSPAPESGLLTLTKGQSREDCGVDPLPSSSSSIISSSSDGHTTTVTRTTTTTEIRGTDGTYTVTTTEKVGTDGTYTTTKTETVDGGVVTSVTTTTVGAATVTSVTTTTVGTATVITTTTQTVGTATSVVTVTGPAVTQTVSVTVYTSVPPGVSTITAYSTVSVTLTTGCSSTWTKEHGDYPTSKWGGSYPGGPIGHYTDKDGDHYGGGGGDTPHTAGPYDPPKLLVTPSNGTISSPSAVVTSGAGRMTMGGLAAWAVAAMLLL